MTPIAVVGIDCRFPGASDKDAFWRLLMDGVVTDTEVPAQRWDIDSYYHPDGIPGTMNTRRAHFIDDADAFDNDFFGIAPVEAAALDPQQRLLLQSSWRALEDAAIDPRSLAGTPTGVFVGVMSSEWSTRQMVDPGGLTAVRGTGGGYFMAANRISYHLGLTGPSMAIDSACSSSLMAIHQGCSALRAGETDTVIAAGANLLLIPALSIFYTQARLSAPDGRCKPFGQGADGIGRGEGVAAVVLRRLDDAVADGQPIYAVVKSSVANHDGRSNGITAPNRRSQVALMRRALQLAEVDAGQVGFVEAHGTGTVLGDMIETNALGDIHRNRGGTPCLLGSVKGNIGHTEGSAGIAAFVKACLALHHRTLPPTVFGAAANPRLRLEDNGLRLADQAQRLSDDALGAVSSFGLGGSNAHAVLQSAPIASPSAPGEYGVLTISAPSPQALRRNAEAVARAMDTVDANRLAAWCRATNAVKRSLRQRLVLDGDRDAILGGLRQFGAGAHAALASSTPPRTAAARVGLLCSGQGTPFPGMTRPLYDVNPVYRGNLDAVLEALDPHVGSDLRAVIFGDGAGLDDTALAQPALFAVSYALGQTLLQSGIRFAFGIGHSLGEIAAACLAGVLSVEDAGRLVAIRGRLMGSLPSGGAMIAADLDAATARAALAEAPGCVIAAVNGPRSLTISGAADAVAHARAAVQRHGGKTTDLSVSHAFHSPLMQPMVDAFRRELTSLEPRRAEFPLFSTVLGTRVEGPELDADYWARQICAPVRFLDAVRAAVAAVPTDYAAEAGPGSTLLTLARGCGLPPDTASLVLCDGRRSQGTGSKAAGSKGAGSKGTGPKGTEMFTVAATLLRDGFSPDLTPLYGRPAGVLHRLPPYVFDPSRRYWFDPGVTVDHFAPAAPPAAVRAPTDTPTPTAIATATATETGTETASATTSAIDRAVLNLIAEIGGYPATALTAASRLAEDLGYDSLLQVRLLERLRTEFPPLAHITVADVLPRIHSVGDLVDFVTERLERARDTRTVSTCGMPLEGSRSP